MKLAWGIVNKSNHLWVQVMKSKYQRRGNINMVEVGCQAANSFFYGKACILCGLVSCIIWLLRQVMVSIPYFGEIAGLVIV